jgi:hypothetical protein
MKQPQSSGTASRRRSTHANCLLCFCFESFAAASSLLHMLCIAHPMDWQILMSRFSIAT